MGNSACARCENRPAVQIVKKGGEREKGEPSVSFRDPEVEAVKLQVKVLGARGIRNADWLPGMGTSDCYCTVKIKGKEDSILETKTINNCLTPIWQEEADATDYSEGDALEFSVWDADMGKSPDLLGKAALESEEFAKTGYNGELELQECGKDVRAYIRVKVRAPGQDDYPPGAPVEFSIKFDRDKKQKTLGLDVDDSDGKVIYIFQVNAGPFRQYNEQVKPAEQLKAGDFMLRINDKEGDSKMLVDELRTANAFDILVRRPEEICVAIDKGIAKAPLGLDFSRKLTGTALLITKVGDGPFETWNRQNEDRAVRPGDRVISVSGFQGRAAELRNKMIAATAFQAIIIRPAHMATSWWYF